MVAWPARCDTHTSVTRLPLAGQSSTMTRTRLTTVDSVPENGSWLFTVRERDGREEEVILVRCDADATAAVAADDVGAGNEADDADATTGADTDDAAGVDADDADGTGEHHAVEAWRNFCQHETDQRLDRGFGAAVRDGEVVCPKHGSMFDTCTGYCDNGKAADSFLSGVDVTVEDGVVYLTDEAVEFLHEGGIEDDDGDDGPSSTSHLTF